MGCLQRNLRGRKGTFSSRPLKKKGRRTQDHMLIYTTREKNNRHEKDNYVINCASSLGNCFKFCFVALRTGKTLRRNNYCFNA